MVLFEDEGHKHFYPLALTRPMDDLRIGILKIHEKWLLHLGEVSFSRTVRPTLEPVYGKNSWEKGEGDTLWVNARFLPDKDVVDRIRQLKTGEGLSSCGVPVVIRLSSKDSAQRIGKVYPDFSRFLYKPVASGFLLSRVWELFQRNGDEILKDFDLLGCTSSSVPTVTEHSILVGQDNICFGEDVKVDAGVIIDALDGPVYIGSNAQIMSGAILKGPVAVCDGAVIKMGAKIYPETTIGPVCKVGGEVKNVVFQGYSNKAHEGYLGNSLIGEWCNFGADTNSSNLKNNYKEIYLNNWETGERYEKGIDYCGTIMGDHGKTAINTMLGTGTVCGVACNLFGSGFNPKVIPSFSWIGDQGAEVHVFDKAMETAERVMAHRNIPLTDSYRAMMRNIFENRCETSQLRKGRLVS